MFQGFNLRHIFFLTRVYGRAVLRSGAGLLFLNMFLFSGLIIASVMIDTVKPIQQSLEEREKRNAEKAQKEEHRRIPQRPQTKEDVYRVFHRAIVAWFIGVKDEGDGQPGAHPFLDYLMDEQSPILSSYFIILLACIPFTSCMAAFNQYTGDIGTKGLRYLLLRTERINIFLSRFLGTLLFVNVISFAMIFAVVAFIVLKFPPATAGDTVSLFAWGFRGWFAVFVFGLPYLCLCSWISTLLDTPIVSLILSYLAVGFPILVLKIVGASIPGDFKLDGWTG
jgi:hypothetical protein